MNRIALAANNNFELQTILIAEIETYETLQGTASAAGTSVAGAVAAARTAKKCNVVWVFWDVVVGHIERFQWSYKRWEPDFSTHLVMYWEPRLRKFCYNRVFKKKEEVEQLLENGWDLNLSSNDPDFVATPDKQVFFNRFRQSYHRKGCRFMHLFASFEVDNIDGTGCGAYEVPITTDMSEATVVTLRNKFLEPVPTSRTATMRSPQAVLRFSRQTHRSGFIKTVTDTYNCVHFSDVVKNLEATS